MRIDIVTLFPEMFRGPLDSSILGRARERGLLSVHLWNIRDFADDRHKTVDDAPYGGGPGMILKAPPVYRAVETIWALEGDGSRRPWTIAMSPQGTPLQQAKVARLAQEPHLVIICGHYEGMDERVYRLADEEISIGDYIVTGGELPAMVVVDAVARLIPGVLGEGASARHDSFSDGLLEYPQYTRPVEFRGMRVPEVLLSGDHERIRRWRRKQSLRRTLERRPDLLFKANLSDEDRRLLTEDEDP